MRILSKFIILFSFTFALSAHAAAPVIVSADGVSNLTLTSTTGGSATIYGGFAGLSTACPNDSSGNLCNNCSAAANACADTPLCACNESRAFLTQKVTIHLTSDVAGQAILGKSDGSTLTSIQKNLGNDGTAVEFFWGDMCTAIMGGTCDGGALTTNPATFRIYLDKDRQTDIDSGEEFVEVSVKVINPGTTDWNFYGDVKTEGIGGFTPYPGDKKIYVEDVASNTGFPSLSYGSEVKKVRVYMSSAGKGSPIPHSILTPANLTVEEDGAELSDSVVDGLENNVRYAFRVALVDEANNVVQFFPSATTATANGCDSSPPAANCPWAATPDQVLGLLSEDFNCFIASAAYGTSIEPKLDVFRKFRFKILLQRPWGRKFVEQYYHYGPYAARYIHDKPILRGIARGFLWPLYGFSLMSLSYGLPVAVATSLILMISLLALAYFGMRSFKRRA
jgi:hypothetical protein